MNKPVYVGLATGKTLRLIIAVIPLVLAGRAFNADAQTVTILHSFIVSPTDGAFPWAGLVQGSDGNFYGTTFNGGTQGDGTVFRISSSGTYTNLYSFYTFPSDGAFPRAALVQGSDGNFYGTASAGGTHGDGSVFRIGSSGSETNLHTFVGTPDGASPYAGLVQGSDGNFYGTALYGGTSTNCGAGVGCGTVFQISPSGTYTTLYSFVGSPSDGQRPSAGLVQGSDGNFYGTTRYGGTYGDGTVFRISPGGNETNLHMFVGIPDGASPYGGLVQGSDGSFYGTTFAGGAMGGRWIGQWNPSNPIQEGSPFFIW